jgi:hypothetical protein
MSRVSYCPICGDLANSTHHIKPRAEGGSSRSINRVKLCKRCHNIVEELTDKGLVYSPALISYIRIDYDISITKRERTVQLKRYIKTRKPKQSPTTYRQECSLCKKEYYKSRIQRFCSSTCSILYFKLQYAIEHIGIKDSYTRRRFIKLDNLIKELEDIVR